MYQTKLIESKETFLFLKGIHNYLNVVGER